MHFDNPKALSTDLTDRDKLLVVLMNPDQIFNKQGKVLQSINANLDVEICQQFTEEENEQFLAMLKTGAQVALGISILEICILFLLQKIASQMWILINALQFIALMGQW